MGELGMYVVTTCNTIIHLNENPQLVMGKGAAEECKERYFGIDSECAHVIINCWSSNYGFRVVRKSEPGKPGIGIFHTKRHWRNKALLDLISLSVKTMRLASMKSEFVFRLNYPGIGAGGLKREDVEPLLMDLPGNVTICYR